MITKVEGGERFLHFDQLHDVKQIRALRVQAGQELVQIFGLNFESVSKHVIIILVQDWSDAAKHLEQEGFSVEDVELLADVLDGLGDQLVGLIVGVDPKQVGHHQKVAIVREDVLELVGRVDDRSQAVSTGKKDE